MLATAASVNAAGAQVETEGRLDLRAARFYRAASGRTLFDVFGRVPFAMLHRLTGGEGPAAYRVAVSVKDSSGLELLSRSWTQVVSDLPAEASRASAVEHVSFATDPGRYTLEVTVTDSATGRMSRRALELRAYGEPPAASDLLLSTGVRGAEADTAARPGEVRKGPVFLEASGRPVLTPQDADLGYYLEVYRDRPETAAVALTVRAEEGTFQTAVGQQRVPLEAGGGVLRATMDLAGLPPGDYRLELTLRLSDTTVRRAAEFGMAGFETAAAVAPAEPADIFAGMSEAQLDTLYLPLVYLMTRDEQGVYEGLSVRGKRAYLRQFWARRDPTPGTPRNEAQEDFYRRIAEANRRFRESGAAEVPGWRTDRGRIFITNGPPDEVLQRPQAGSTNPYEVWKYTRGRALKYVFLDVTQFGNYSLIYTNDRREVSRPNWQALLGPEAVLDVERF